MLNVSQKYAYHGGLAALACLNPAQLGPDGELLCSTLSVNVARRYGPVVTRLVLNDVCTKTMSVKEWMSNATSLDTLRTAGYRAVRVTGSKDCFDFPVDMVVVLCACAVNIDRVLADDELRALCDGLSVTHAPDGPAAVGWAEWLADQGQDLEASLLSLDWRAVQGLYEVSVPADKLWRSYSVTVSENSATSFDISDDWGTDAQTNSLQQALRIADQWRRDEIVRRTEYREDLKKPRKAEIDLEFF